MEVSEAELREMVRVTIARHGVSSAVGEASIPSIHASHVLLPLQRGGDADGACIIEPSVRCNHCGYCLSYGH